MELIVIEKIGTENFVKSLKDLYLNVGMSKPHWSKWCKKNVIENIFFSENEDYQTFFTMANGNETIDFSCSVDMAKHLIMQMPTEKAHEYRQYLIDYEKGLFKVPTTFREALLLAAEQQLVIEEQGTIIKEQTLLLDSQKGKVEVYDRLTDSDNLLTFKQARYLLGYKTKGNFKFFLKRIGAMDLVEQTIKSTLYTRKYFYSTYDNNGILINTYITQRGLVWLQKRKSELGID